MNVWRLGFASRGLADAADRAGQPQPLPQELGWLEPLSATNALPLLMTHGWPGSTFELLKVIESVRDARCARTLMGTRP